MARGPSFVLAMALLASTAGCVGGEPETEGSPRGTENPSVADAALPFKWRSDAIVGSVVGRIVLDIEQEAQCRVYGAVASVATGAYGPDMILLVDTHLGKSWGVSSYRPFPGHVHSEGIVDTRTILAPSGRAASGTEIRGPMEGEVTLTLMGRDLEAWDNDITGNASFLLEAECDEPATVIATAGSADVFTFDDASLSGGHSASVLGFPSASVALDEGATVTFRSPSVEVRVGGFDIAGASHGELVVTTPLGEERWPLTSVGFIARPAHETTGPPGEYAFSLRRASAALGSAFWGTAYGLSPLANVSELEEMSRVAREQGAG